MAAGALATGRDAQGEITTIKASTGLALFTHWPPCLFHEWAFDKCDFENEKTNHILPKKCDFYSRKMTKNMLAYRGRWT